MHQLKLAYVRNFTGSDLFQLLWYAVFYFYFYFYLKKEGLLFSEGFFIILLWYNVWNETNCLNVTNTLTGDQ